MFGNLRIETEEYRFLTISDENDLLHYDISNYDPEKNINCGFSFKVKL